jgi:hypothetical protein
MLGKTCCFSICPINMRMAGITKHFFEAMQINMRRLQVQPPRNFLSLRSDLVSTTTTVTAVKKLSNVASAIELTLMEEEPMLEILAHVAD